jgi:crotonobetainyl-CoA:carnitine CoA-transferase CaiB-like acyl-CoA transferase
VSAKAALAGMRVIGITNWASGAYAEQLLGDMGAEIVRIEKPGRGDDARHLPPFHHGESTTYLFPNRNKKSITLNLKAPEGVALLKRLAAKADVVIENNRPGTLDRLGVGYEALSKLNPRLVMTSISGFGQTGPYRDLPAYDMNIQAITGLMSLTGMADGPPLRTGVAVSDYLAGLNAAYATLVALLHRFRTDEGQHIDVSLYESAIAVLGTALQDQLLMGTSRTRCGNRFGALAPSNTYRCTDGWLLITVANDAQWSRLAPLLPLDSTPDLPALEGAAQRAQHLDLLDAIVGRWTAKYTVAQATSLLSQAGIPCGAINTMADLVADPHFRSRDVAVEVQHPTAGPMKLVAPMPKLSRTPGRVSLPPPLLGQHNAEIFGTWLGIEGAELTRLSQAGVV